MVQFRSKELTLTIYNELGWISLGVAVVVLAVSPVVKRWMHLDTLKDVRPDDVVPEAAGQPGAMRPVAGQ